MNTREKPIIIERSIVGYEFVVTVTFNGKLKAHRGFSGVSDYEDIASKAYLLGLETAYTLEGRRHLTILSD